MLDCARKLAKRREAAANKQQASAPPEGALQIWFQINHENILTFCTVQLQRSTAVRKEAVHSPQYFSKMKYERECKEQERREMMQQHARVSLLTGGRSILNLY